MAEFKFPDFYRRQKERVERALQNWLPETEAVPPPLGEAMRSSVLNGGKRLRGVLVLEAARLGREERSSAAEALAAAVELIHAYSLVHDDLPAMDDDDFRRGEPTCHRQFGEDMAILCGDSLLTLAFEILGQIDEFDIPAPASVKIYQKTARAAGWRGLIGGQVEDLTASESELQLEELQELHLKKTGALIRLSLQLGGIVSGMEEEFLPVLNEFGKKIGLAFQIKDDLLDLQGSFEKIGKDVNSDREAEKTTYPRLLGSEQAEEKLTRLVDEAEELLRSEISESERLIELARLVAERDY